jgi:TPR repeat protein
MSRLLVIFALLGAGWCAAYASDAESERRRQAEEAALRQLEREREALKRERAELERQRAELVRQQLELARQAEDARRREEEAKSRASPDAARIYAEAIAAEQQGNGREAVKLYVRAARAGSGKAALRLAEIYDKGLLGVPRDYAESLKWYNLARTRGEDIQLEAKRRAEVATSGREQAPLTPPDAARLPAAAVAAEQQGKGSEAVKLYVREARAGNGKAAARLGEIYDKGMPGVLRDYAESLRWYNLARTMGEDVPLGSGRRTDAAAEAWARQRAEEVARRAEEAKREGEAGIVPPVERGQVPPEHQAWLTEAVSLERMGEGAKAVAMYRLAARAGNGKAMKRLGEIYDKGIPGVAPDYAESLRWFNAARTIGETAPLGKAR